MKVDAMPPARKAGLFALFFAICLGLGYPSLNRVDRRTAPGLTDVQGYAKVVTEGSSSNVDDIIRFRVLVPYLARPIYRAVNGHLGSWDPVMFGLLAVDSAFVAGTSVLLAMTVEGIAGDDAMALGVALLYLLNFAVPNLRLAGFIDSGEGFLLMAVVWVLMKDRYWMLPMVSVLGAMAKETFVPYLIAFTAAWWLCEWKAMRRPMLAAAWIAASWTCAAVSITMVHWTVLGSYSSLISFGASLRGDTSYGSNLLHSLADRNLYYIFIWLLPLSLVRLRQFPKKWRMATAASAATAFVLDLYAGGASGIGRALFDVAGPLLSASVAMLLFENSKPARVR